MNRDEYAAMALRKYGAPPEISRSTAKRILKSVGVNILPQLGCEINAGEIKYGTLWIRNCAGRFQVECYQDVMKDYPAIQKKRKQP